MPKPGSRNLITDVRGVLVGRSNSASVAILGGAPGTRDTALLEPEMTVEHIDAIVLSGGSAWGLSAADGVMAWLGAERRGFPVGGLRVPIVPQAILFDLLNGGAKPWARGEGDGETPYRALGRRAVSRAGGAV